MDVLATQLIALVRRGSAATPPPSAPPLLTPPQWERLGALAVEQGVAPLIWHALTGLDGVPEGALRALAREAQRSVGAGLLREHALRRLLETLAERQIAAIVLKGAALAYQLYPRPELRPYGDIDVLVRPTDYARLHRALRDEGYEAGDPAGVLKVNRSPLESYFPRPFVSPVGATVIEAHFDLLQFGLVERHAEAIWRQAVWLDAAGLPLPVLGPAHQLLHLAAHVHRHSYGRLLWLLDLDLAVRRWEATLDWRAVLTLAREEGMGTVLRYALAQAHTLLGTPRPALGAWTIEERLLFPAYRRLWPASRLGSGLLAAQRHRLTRFYPETGDCRDTLPGLALLGRRRAKAGVLLRYWRSARDQPPGERGVAQA